ncbi:MAG TPA: amino acid--[acyl-carrier-protein] ligase [Solirubrobacteraceae bacterium]|jgi:seryl-tRNA synthetase|nr:amino acid--[acyl-carrier-protein] ligase [Solirubrobacteraceae bacterium]
MAEFRAGSTEQEAYLNALVEAGLLTRSGVHGLYARGAGFERVRLGFDGLVTRTAASESPEPLYFPPLLPRKEIETNGYLGSFPHLAGTIFAFEGDEQDAEAQLELANRHEDWSRFQHMSEMVLTPAACYPLYPAVAARGALPDGGLTLDTGDSYVFRREPSSDPARMQIFHMREIVRVADQDTVIEWRIQWRERAEQMLVGLGLSLELDIANDPFFGRSGRLLASQQRHQELKWELLAPVAGDHPTAIASSNYHQDHFGQTYDLRTAGGELAHTGCMAFGEERVTLALFAAHGLDLREWPREVTTALELA